MLLSFRSILGGVCVYFFLSAFLISCEQKRHTFSFEERKTIDSILRQYQTEEELVRIQSEVVATCAIRSSSVGRE